MSNVISRGAELLGLSKLGLFVSAFAEELIELLVVGHLLGFAFAVVAAEGNLGSLELNGCILVEFSAGEWASLLGDLRSSDQLMVGLGSHSLLVCIELAFAVIAAEINAAFFPVACLSFFSGSTGDQALDFGEVNLFSVSGYSRKGNQRGEQASDQVLHR